MSSESQEIVQVEEELLRSRRRLEGPQIIGWFSVGMAVAALGIYLGAELRSRSKFKKRTPYDFYSNAGERRPANLA